MIIAESFAKTAFARFINSTPGRALRVVAGAAMIGWGAMNVQEAAGIVVMVVGCIPLYAGAMDRCLVSALLGGPISGSRVREIAGKR